MLHRESRSVRPAPLHGALLASVSALAVLIHAAPAGAGCLACAVNAATSNATSAAAAAAVTSVQQAAAVTQQSMTSLTRSIQAIQAMQAAQAAARSAALAKPGAVPNGLVPGGLVVAPNAGDPAVWQGANLPTQSTGGGVTTVTIQQTAAKAILTWSSFNVGANTQVYFNQSAGNSAAGNDWIALNRVVDPSGIPSQILGSIRAEGQVYLINQNGIIFGGGSQVNVNSLVATSLPMFGDTSTNQIVPGSAAWDAAVQASNKAFLTGGLSGNFLGSSAIPDGPTVQPTGDITIAAGAQINAGNLGHVLIAAPDVTNAGTITANTGQVLLLAGMSVSTSGSSPGTNDQLSVSLSEPVIFVTGETAGSLVLPPFIAANTGLIQAATGNVTMQGYSVTQNGVIVTTTSVARPGSITLTAVDEGGGEGGGRVGPVLFGPQSVAAILPDTPAVDALLLALPQTPTVFSSAGVPVAVQGALPADTQTTTSSAANASFQSGTVAVTGGSVTLQGDGNGSGALVDAPSGTVSLIAVAGETNASKLASNPTVSGRVYIDSGAVVDVSGLANVELPMSANLVTTPKLTADDVADQPLQQNGFLIGQTITVDSRISGVNPVTGQPWVGTPLIDAAGDVQDMPRTVDQLMTNGGTIHLGGGEVITAPGSVLNLAGGYIHYLGGTVATTAFIGADGRIYSAAGANPLVPIVGIAGQYTVDHTAFGITDTYTDPLLAGASFQPGYVQGGNGGTLDIYASPQAFVGVQNTGATILGGTILGGAVAGPYQLSAGAAPAGGTFEMIADFGISAQVFPGSALGGTPPSGTLAIVIDQANPFAALPRGFTADTPLPTPALATTDPGNFLFTTTLSAPLLDAAGFSTIALTANDNPLTVNAGTTLAVAPGGRITFNAGTVTIDGNLLAPSGQINVTSTGVTLGPLFPSNPPPPGNITVGPGAVISTAGLWVNDAGAAMPTGSAFINGGSITLQTQETGGNTGAVILQSGSLLDVSSGGYVQPNGQLLMANGVPAGTGGAITLATFVGGGPPVEPTSSGIVMDGTLRGYGFAADGTLSLQAPGIQIGGDAATAPAYALVLAPDFFVRSGFGAYNLTSIYDATVVAGTTVTPTQSNFIPNLPALLHAPTGTSLYGAGTAQPDGTLVTIGRLDAFHRAPTSFSITADAYLNGSPSFAGVTGTLLLDQGAAIDADPGATVTLTADGQLTILGVITAPGGTIALNGAFATAADRSKDSIWLGSASVLDVSGTALVNPLAAPGTGKVLPGGSVTIVADNGYVIAQAGANIDADGASGVFELPQSTGAGGLQPAVTHAPTPVWSDAGVITLGATSGLYFDGTVSAHGGAAQAQGGTLKLEGVLFVQNNTRLQTAAILVQQSGPLVPPGLQPGGMVETASTPSGIEHFSADTLDGSGITSLVLGFDPSTAAAGSSFAPLTIAFAGPVNLSLGQSFIADASTYMVLAAVAPGVSGGIPGIAGMPGLATGTFNATGGATVSIAAPYVDLSGSDSISQGGSFRPVLAAGDGALNVAAQVIDLTGQFNLENVGNASVTASGDIRLYTQTAYQSFNGTTPRPGELVTAGNVMLAAADIYPATANTFIIDANATQSNGSPIIDNHGKPLETTVTIVGNGSSTTPLSAGGGLLIDATTIVQNGTLRAPSGTIALGVSDTAGQAGAFNDLPLVQTASVTLGAGSVTSVSFGGAVIPFGTTTDGVDFQFVNLGLSATTPDLSAPPVKVISLAGTSIMLAPGATVDLSGGGTLQAQEFVAGTGGSRNLLLQVNTNFQNGGAAPVQTPLFPDDRQIYAVLPGFGSPAAPFDPEFVQPGSAVGSSVFLTGTPGLPAGVYTLLPAQYATLPGAFRVVQNTSVTNALPSGNATLADGTAIVAGYFTNTLTGARSAQTTSFEVQSAAVWGRYSQYVLTSADSFFTMQAAQSGTPLPRLAVDAGQLTIAAVSGLTLGGTLDTAPGAGGRGAEVDIASQDIEITGSASPAMQGYLQIGAAALDALGAESLLIGGTRTQTTGGVTITAAADSVVVANDAADPLEGPEIILVTRTDPTGADPNAITGLMVQSGAVIRAVGTIAASADVPITIGSLAANGSAAVSGDGALLAVSNGAPVTVTRVNVPGSPIGQLTVQANTTLAGGQSLILDSAGNTTVDPAAVLSGNTITADAGTITFVPADNVAGQGLVIGPATLAQFAAANTVILQSRGVMDFAGNITVALDHGTLELGAGAFTTSTASDVAVTAPTLVLTNALGAPGTFAGPVSGTLTLNATELDFGTGEAGSSTAPVMATLGFAQVTATATGAVVFQGTGGVFNFGNTSNASRTGSTVAVPVTLNTPLILADSGATQTLQTTGILTLNPLAGVPLQRDAIGGAVTLVAASINDGVAIAAPAGNVNLEATTGDLMLTSDATISVAGIAKQFFDVTEFAPAGVITLTADQGNVTVPQGAVLNFSANAGGGSAGSLTISAPTGVATLAGTITGAAAPGFIGGSFTLVTGGSAVLGQLAGELSASGVTNAITITTGQGNLVLPAAAAPGIGNTLTANTVSLTANGGAGNASDTNNGNVIIDGIINANGVATASGGTEGGTISLYGRSGVDIEGTLTATGSDAYLSNGAVNPNSTQLGGIVNIGTSGTPTQGSYNQIYGYENVARANSGAITLGANAIIDVSGGGPLTMASDGLAGGVVNLRAPLLDDGSVNVTISMTNPGSQIRGARAVNLEAYAVWSTTDATSGAQHFDGIVDPAGWYDSSGNLLAGTFTDQSGNSFTYTPASGNTQASLSNEPGATPAQVAADLRNDLQNDFFTPTTANADHQTFYGYVNGNAMAAQAGTLMGFIQVPGFVAVANTAGIVDSSGNRIFHEVPGVELDNPSASVNGGAISVLTDWNLGAGTSPTALAFRFQGQAPVITFRAAGNVNVDASVSDGFFQVSPGPNLGISQTVLEVIPADPTAADNEFTDNPSFVGFAETVPAHGGGSFTVTPGQFYVVFGAPDTGQSQAYYDAYTNYVGTFGGWQARVNAVIIGNAFGNGALTASPTITAAVAAAAPNPANFPTYAAYTSAYDTFLETSPLFSNQVTSPTPPPPVPPTALSDYTASYLNGAYSTYLSFVGLILSQNYGGRGVGAALYIYPPAPPPMDPFVPVLTPVQVPIPQTTAGGNSPSPMPTLQNPEALAVATLAGGLNASDYGPSSSYRFVAGAAFEDADPLATQPAASGQGSVTMDGHFTVLDQTNTNRFASQPPALLQPTTVRTGTGSIDIAAAQDFQLLDTTAPGVVYTAGTPAANTTASTTVSIATFLNSPLEYLATGGVNPVAAGNISIRAGNDILGMENVFDTTGQVTGTPGTFTGQFWWPWMETANPTVNGTNADGGGATVAISSSINFAAFDQGVMSVGGNVAVAAGHNISDLAVSLPTTWYLTAPGSAAPATSFNLVQGVVTTTGLTVHTVGGGNLAVGAGGDILSGDYFVARGAGTITAGGQVGPDFSYTVNTVVAHGTTPVSTLLAVQDATLTVTARSSADIGGVFDPSLLPQADEHQNYSAKSAITVQSTTGDVTLLGSTLSTSFIGSLANHFGGNGTGFNLPATVNLIAFNGGIAIDAAGALYPSAQGGLNLIAAQTIQLSNQEFNLNGTATSTFFGLVALDPATLDSPLNPLGQSFTVGFGAKTGTGRLLFDNSLHASDPNPVRIYSLTGDIVDGSADANGFLIEQIELQPNKPALIEAGRDIVDLTFLGQNYGAADVTRIVAGRDILDMPLGAKAFFFPSDTAAFVPALQLAGPGTFDIEAGRNLGPLTSANEAFAKGYISSLVNATSQPAPTGIETIGNANDAGLPATGASIVTLFGVGPGINTQGFAATYIDPEAAPVAGVPSFASDLVAFVQQFDSDQNRKSSTAGNVTTLTPEQAWGIFETLPVYRQQLFVDQVFFSILNTTGTDVNNPSSPFFGQYARGFVAINTLFPASFGYTQNNLGGGTNGSNAPVATGNLDMRGSTIQTQQGGDVSVLGPGGEVLVGSTSAPPFIVNSAGQALVGPNQQGILTLQTGNISIFSDQSLLLAQSRVFTEEGGNLVIWSSNGDINAGQGARSTAFVPPLTFICDVDDFCSINPAGEVTGAGIATLQTIPGAPPGNVDLIAPRGTVDAGSAGIRVSGNLNIAALFVLNAFNIQVQGVTIGIPTVATPSIGALTAASNTVGATQAAVAAPAATAAGGGNSVIIVEVVGYGGGDAAPSEDHGGVPPQDQQPRKPDRQGAYDPHSRYQIVGLGAVTKEQAEQLTDERRAALGR